MKAQSMEEANLTCSDISVYGAATPKISRSFLTAVSALKSRNSTKTASFNFQGSLFIGGDTMKNRRDNLTAFMDSHFSDNDILVITDAPKTHIPLGKYDRTKDVQGFRPKDLPLGERLPHVDDTYWQNMIQSKFTICPGGDNPWSMRFYEAILAGSIPIIFSKETDLNGFSGTERIPFWFDQIGYKYFTADEFAKTLQSKTGMTRVKKSKTSNPGIDPELINVDSIADKNYKLFLQYQTFENGDQVPPAYSAYNKRCLSEATCRQSCWDA